MHKTIVVLQYIYCRIAVDGGWGKWSEWSPCSVTCGNGTKNRHRYCNNPAPDNGGLDCPGIATDHTVCAMDECRGKRLTIIHRMFFIFCLAYIHVFRYLLFFPVCGNLTVTEHVILSCENDTKNINCTISCEEGYDFDHFIKPYYECGEVTYMLWDFKTSDNPDGKLPQCTSTYDNVYLQIILFMFAKSIVFSENSYQYV